MKAVIIRWVRKLSRWMAVGLFAAVISPMMAAAAEPDWRSYNELLNEYVSPGQAQGVTLNQVNYSALKSDPRWQQLLAMLESYPLASLESRQEKIAFYINAYNVLAIKTVVDHWPLESIKDVGSWLSPVWKRDAGMLGGSPVSLDHIEHGVLRKLDEPGIHFAIVCASLSCPDLRTEAFVAERLEMQLSDQLQQFVANDAKGAQVDGNRLRISKIFDWFEGDFKQAGGVVPYIQKNTGISATKLDGYLNYDWRVNGY
ncbi:MAG: DUF547 domain-containing protein [Motiliproteus sp.]|nr:DUF547 domain-containing protein [Motiliproteus sp.]MCW9051147.1 DUF547 domain-containing protein [Motiliproteus sp.]